MKNKSYTFRKYILLVFCISSMACQSQNSQSAEGSNGPIGGPCEGCEALLEYGNSSLQAIDTLINFGKINPKLLLTGTIYQADGQTPAEDVIIYIYHTNRDGIYEAAPNAEDWARRHGIYRGWVKTNASGEYSFYTFRPAAYPNADEAEHIHMTILDHTNTPYFIENVMFTDDPKLTQEKISRLNKRGGSGVVDLVFNGELLVAKRDIFLGRNISNYPK